MKKIIPIVIICCCIHQALAQAPDIQWQKSLGGTGSDEAYSIQQTTDGGYIVAGTSSSNDGDVSGNHGGTIPKDFWVVKLNSIGNIEWQKSLGGSSDDVAYSIQQTSDGGYIVAGYSGSKDGDVSGNHGAADFWVVKLNSIGNIEWQKSLGGSGVDIAYSIQQTIDGGYIVVGSSSSKDGDVSDNHGALDCWVVKLNSLGAIEWQKSFGGVTGLDYAYSVQQTHEGGYIVAGRAYLNSGDPGCWVVKLNSIGNVEWQNSFGGLSVIVMAAFSIQQITSGGYILAGYTSSSDYSVIKLDATGNVVWQKSFGGSGTDGAYSIHETSDSGYIVAGVSGSNNGDVTGNHGQNDYWVVKLDIDGKMEWQKALGGSSNEIARSIQQTSDDGYIVAGYSNSNDGDVSGNRGNSDFWVVKLEGHKYILKSLEVIQTVQNWKNDIPLIERKPTLVRAHLQEPNKEVPAVFDNYPKLYAYRNGELIRDHNPNPISAINENNFGIQWETNDFEKIRKFRKDIDKSLNFILPREWRTGDITLKLEDEKIACEDPSGKCEVDISFKPSKQLDLRFFDITWSDNTGNFFFFSKNDFNSHKIKIINELRAMLPINDISWEPDDFLSIGTIRSNPEYDNYEDWVEAYFFKKLDDFRKIKKDRRLYAAILKAPYLSLTGTSSTFKTSSFPDSITAKYTLLAEFNESPAHEFGHLLGRAHTLCEIHKTRQHEPQFFPPENTYGGHPRIGPLGVNINDDIYGYNFREKRIYSADETFEIMSYCKDHVVRRWMSGHTYKEIYNWMEKNYKNDEAKESNTCKKNSGILPVIQNHRRKYQSYQKYREF